MENNMFCFQCEQTAGCAWMYRQSRCLWQAGGYGTASGSTDRGTHRSCPCKRGNVPGPPTDKVNIEGLFTTVTNVNFNNETINTLIDRVHEEKHKLVPDCESCGSPCGRTEDYDMKGIWEADEDIRSLKSLILFGIRGMALMLIMPLCLDILTKMLINFSIRLFLSSVKTGSVDELLPVVMEVGEVNLKCMALLDKANTRTYGTPESTTVPLTVEKGPFIVVTGHDLYDLKQLLEQTKDKGINIYTHGEMLPAHAYPGVEKISAS